MNNMNTLKIIACGATLLLSSCGIYTSYKPQTSVPENLYGEEVTVSDTASIGNIHWRDFFTDPYLQDLIEKGLAQNTDVQTASLRVEEAKASLLSAKLAFLPSFALSPQGGVNTVEGSKASLTYTLPVTASWELDIFGKLRNAKRQAKAAYLQSEDYKQAVYSSLIANIANTYYTLLMLDEQLEISRQTADTWKETVESTQALMDAGQADEAAVSQMRATYYEVENSVMDLEEQINQVENSLSLLLAETPHKMARGKLSGQQFTSRLSVGVPLQMLSNRPDVKVAEMALAGTYYNANEARAAFYPSITLTGSAGWTNSAGSAIINPGKVLLSALGSLTQPLFYRGANIARLKIAKAQQEEAMLSFEQTILNAGSEVSNALSQYETASQKLEQRILQINSLEKSVEYTQKLLTFGTSTYLEVLTAQQSLLSAQLSGVSDQYSQMQAVVTLYRALGGGVK